MNRFSSLAAAMLLLATSPVLAQKTIYKDSSQVPPGAGLIESYGSYALYQGGDSDSGIDASYMDFLLIDAFPFDTQRETLRSPNGFSFSEPQGSALHLVQFHGPIKDEWLQSLDARGIQPVHYIAQNGYLVWTDQAGRDALAEMSANRANGLQFTSVYHSFFKVGPALLARIGKGAPDATEVTVTVQMFRHDEGAGTEQFLADIGQQLSDWSPILDFQNARFAIRLDDLQAIASRTDVYWIGEVLPRELNDEVQAQIIAGNFNGDMSGPLEPGYLPFLDSLGFSQDQGDYPIVDVTDDGIGNGTTASGDPTFHEAGNIANPTRLAYVANCTNSPDGRGLGGHGHINTSIAGGFDNTSGFPFQDPNGYQRGMGMNPYGRFAGTRIFDPTFDQSACGGNDAGLIKSVQDNGAAINTNSWGCAGCAGTYDDSSQAYDVGVRDADAGEAGNQELIVIFSAGNSGPGGGTIGSPGNGKNMITVGASENDRPGDEDGNWTDGCAIGPTGADDAMDVIGFSSRGPAPGGRIKPEVIAPGTHIQGTASTDPGYNGGSVCDQFRPSGQTAFAASSGTSHSTPALAGVASLAYYWIENGLGGIATDGPGAAPSPAMMKSYMIAHPTYLSGVSANDTLPSNSQGYGQPTVGLLFDGTPKYIHDQATVFDNSGENWVWTGAAADPSKPVRIVLTYTDAAGAIGTSPQVNDLNLTVESDGNIYLGNRFSGQWSVTGGTADAANNYEAVFLPAGTATDLTITIDAFNIAGDGIPNSGDDTDQDFALTCYNCAQEPTFTLGVEDDSASICAPDDAVYDLNIGSILGFTESVTLAASGNPAGTSTAFGANPVTPPGSSTLTIGNTGSAAAGSYTVSVEGVSTPSGVMKSRELDLDLYTANPGEPVLTAPTDNALNVPVDILLTWDASSQEQAYLVEVDDNADFGSPEFSTTTGLTSAQVPPGTLNTNTHYYWRVSASNECGGSVSETYEFSTVAAPGDCGEGSSPVIYFQDSMNSEGGWTHSAATGSDTWVLDDSDANSPTMSWHADDIPSPSDQRLVSPPVVVPEGVSALTLQYWTRFDLEERSGGGCWDAGILEYSTDGGSSWTQVGDAMLDTLPYTGNIQNSANPLSNLPGWCNVQPWVESVVDLDGLDGETLNFRFRLGTDGSVGAGPWHIDDVVVQSCELDSGALPFDHGFEGHDAVQ